MPMTAIRPDSQVQTLVNPTQNLPAGPTLQTNAVYLEDIINGILSQTASILGTGNWYDAIYTTADGKQRAIAQLNQGLDTVETKSCLNRYNNLTNITVPAGQNYVILVQANGQDPSVKAAIGATTLGAVVAQSSLSGSGFGANELTSVAGADSLNPKNRAVIINASNGQSIESQMNDIYGLLQVESTATDGSAFNDTSGGCRLKISFVTINQSTKSYQACPASDIGGQTINYSYVVRNTYLTSPETATLGSGAFVDNIGTADITLTEATLNQNGNGIPVNTPVLWRVAANQAFSIQSSTGASTYFSVNPTSSGVAASLTASTFAMSTTSPVTSTAGATFASAGQAVNVGVTTGQIDSAGLTVASTGSNPLKLNSGAQIAFKDGYLTGSSWQSAAVNLASSSAEVNAYRAAFGEVSLMAGITAAAATDAHKYVVADVVGGIIAAGTNLTGAGASPNLSMQFPSYAAATNIPSQVKLIRNGLILRYGTGNDWVAGTNPATGDVVLSLPVRGSAGGVHGDCLTMETFGL